MAVPEWKELYFAHYRTILNRWINWKNVLEPLNKKFQDRIRADIAKDSTYLFSKTYFNPSFSGRILFNGHYIHGLKEVVVGREGYLRARAELKKPEPQFKNITYSSAPVVPGQKVQVTVSVTGTPAIKAVVIRSTSNGIYVEDPMFDDGQHGDGKASDGVYGGTFTAKTPARPTRFYIHATDTANTVQVHPAEAEHVFFSVPVVFPKLTSDVSINEFVADNETGDKDAAGDYDDWVEIHNRGTKPFDASGCYLSDDLDNLKLWKIPANTTIPAGGFLRVWCDGEPAEGPLHATFRLGKKGGVVVLSDKDSNSNSVLDGLTYPDQKGDRAFGRLPDGTGDFFYLWNPSALDFVTGSGPGAYAPFGVRRDGAPSGVEMLLTGAAQEGKVLSVHLTKGQANSSALIAVSAKQMQINIGPAGVLLLDPSLMVTVGVGLDANGFGGFSAKIPTGLAGLSVYLQGLSLDLSNATVVRISK